PDPATFRILPWRTGESHKVGRVFCDILKPGGEPYEGDPRWVMRRALARAADLGFDHFYLGPELEFFLFKDDQGTEILDKGGYFDLTTLDVASDFRRDAAKGFIAGLLRHARELSALFAPSVNSYKRLVLGYEAPVYVAWSRRNRSALVRVPVYHPGKEKATRCELRCPDPSCNPYLTFAAMLHAGLDGIENGYELPEPIDRNLYDLTHDELVAAGVDALPESL